jgi:isopenicillin-N epimerase
MNRRDFLLTTGLGLAAGTLANGCRPARGDDADEATALDPAAVGADDDADFRALRDGLELDPAFIHLAGMLIASHPAPVREAIARYRAALDEQNALFLRTHRRDLEQDVRVAAARYLGARPAEIALTGNTTSGLGLVYAGIAIRPDQHFLTTEHDYYSTRASLSFQSRRTGAEIRRVTLYGRSEDARAEAMVESLMEGVDEKTRVVALTWVHSSTGVKIPVAKMAAALAERNEGRGPEDRALLVLDAVHGLGVEDAGVNDLGCDVYVAGTHKWLLAPRGTGIVWGHPRVHDQIGPTIPTFSSGYGWGGRMTPGGFHAYEHQWAVADAFTLHRRLGRDRVAARIHGHAERLKAGLSEMDHVTLRTPMDPAVSAGVVCFDVAGRTPRQVVSALRAEEIVASVTPYAPSHARFSPAVFNTPEEMDRALAAVAALG